MALNSTALCNLILTKKDQITNSKKGWNPPCEYPPPKEMRDEYLDYEENVKMYYVGIIRTYVLANTQIFYNYTGNLTIYPFSSDPMMATPVQATNPLLSFLYTPYDKPTTLLNLRLFFKETQERGEKGLPPPLNPVEELTNAIFRDMVGMPPLIPIPTNIVQIMPPFIGPPAIPTYSRIPILKPQADAAIALDTAKQSAPRELWQLICDSIINGYTTMQTPPVVTTTSSPGAGASAFTKIF